MNDALSRVEGILEKKVYGKPYNEPPQSRVENLLQKLGNGSEGFKTEEFEIIVDNDGNLYYTDGYIISKN